MVKKISNQALGLKGRIHIKAWQKNDFYKNAIGSEYVSENRIFDNLIVDVGKDTILRYLGNITGGAKFEKIGVGDSAAAAAAGQTALQGTSTLIKVISSIDRVYVRPTLFVSVEFGYTEANFTWNELGLFDANTVLVARQVDASPLVKTSSKRAIVEWQISQ